ncbi:MAG TPA: MASE4 domain-containing protein [Stellaceae bacterium]|nr:MASE4 domain-containing protein [Stellaceae bacterium]
MADGLVQQPVVNGIAALQGMEAEAEPAWPDREPSFRHAFLSTTQAGRGDNRLALAVVLLSAAGFAAAVPFAKLLLYRADAFIPAYEAALTLIDAITAAMLFGQFRWSRSPGLLVLGAGYLFDAVLVIAHLASFPGAVSPAGLLGGGQTTVWLYMFWHGGFPLFIIAYALLNRRELRHAGDRDGIDAAMVGLAVVGTIALSIGLTALAAHHDALLPTLLATDNTYQPAYMLVVSLAWTASLAAIAVVWLQRRRTVLDLWLMVMLCVWVFDIALSAVFNSQRFDLGFYAGRACGLLAASFVLGVLLVETGGLHSRLAAAKALVDDYAHRLEERVRERTAALEAETAERRKAEALLHQAQKMEALGQLTGGLAHDFNNHLGIIIGNLDLLDDTSTLDGDQKELVEEARTAAFNGADLTRRLLAFARRQPLRPARVEVNKLIEEITKLLRRTLGEQIVIDLRLDPTIPAITADPSQLETAIANLANNARDAMPRGGRLTITTGVRHLDADYATEHVEVTPGGYVLIEVSDTGTGMPPEVLARVFEPFFTTKDPGKGTGLGLSMVFGFLKQSGGHINVYSEPGVGTTFRLYLRPDEAIVEENAGPAADPAPLGGTGERILVVEDNEKLRAVLLRQLDELGYRTVAAENALAARKLIESGIGIDLLLTDIIMPGKVDGYQLAREFLAARPGGKVLLTSGFPGARLADLDELGMEMRLLDKPYRKQDLARTLREVLAEPAPTG